MQNGVVHDKRTLVDALISIPAMHGVSNRLMLLDLIRQQRSSFGDVAERAEARLHIIDIDIVSECLRQPGGVALLAGALELMAPDLPGTVAVRDVADLMESDPVGDDHTEATSRPEFEAVAAVRHTWYHPRGVLRLGVGKVVAATFAGILVSGIALMFADLGSSPPPRLVNRWPTRSRFRRRSSQRPNNPFTESRCTLIT